MKKLLFLFLLFNLATVRAQMLEAGDGVVELGYGFPNMMPLVSDPSGAFHSAFDIFENDVKAYGQFIVKGEFMASDRMSFAASFNYGYFHIYEEFDETMYDPVSASYYTNTYFYDTRVHKLRFTAGLNFHMVRTRVVDSYFGVQAGTKKAGISFDTNDPTVNGSGEAYVFPIALRLHYGFRYFFTANWAAHFEIGLGGPVVSFGATYKF
ncbi:MAG: hypothetical protein IPM74_04270 [Crocinitomicaceae bacterium]|nr:hypothetical protein [Crocinitomicaceae bacterium]MBK8925124.1 hypothetical protein [Crocinitomicaceae bacterium]